MFDRLAMALSAVMLGGIVPQALAGGVTIDSREYKLLLLSENFTGDSAEHATEFWDSRLKPIIDKHLDRRNNGESRARKSFALQHQRRVSFKDTPKCTLSAAGFSYRERANWTPGSGTAAAVETTLKFRSPDLFLSMASRFEGRDGAKSKFEEDLSIASHFSTKSGYSYSVSQKQPATSLAASLDGALSAFPGALERLESLSATPPQLEASLVPGPTFTELAYSKAAVDLGRDTEAEFDLTFWYSSDALSLDRPALVEISFAYDTDDGEVDRNVALRASKLFAAMQSDLASWIAPGSQSKTSRALPNDCREK